MSSVVIAGDTSGSITLNAPAIAGTTTLTLPSTSGTVALTASPTFTGQATIPTINLTGGQITFPATQSASADANTLDDYEEGTWSIFLTDGTNNTSTGTQTYTKIGRLVILNIQFYNVTVSGLTAGSRIKIGGIPFVPSGAANSTLSYPNLTYQTIMTQNESTTLGLYAGSGNNVDWQNFTRTLVSTPSTLSIYGTAIYITA